jgi:hypothetical protein
MKKENRSYSIEKRHFKGDFNPSLIFCYMDNEIKLNAGFSDNIEVFREADNFIILTTNEGLNYAGLEYITYHFNEGCILTDDLFFQNVDEIETKKPFFDYSDINQAKILLQGIN